AAHDTVKRGSLPLQSDAQEGLRELSEKLASHRFDAPATSMKSDWFGKVDPLTDAPAESNALPTDMQVIGAVQRASHEDTAVMCAAGTMPGELHKLWKAPRPGAYHMEYGFSCMGYEIAGAMGIKMAEPGRDVICFTGDGTYMMANSEMATAAMMGISFTVIVTDNRGYGCINRLQMGTGGAEFNNLLEHTIHQQPSSIDFVQHAASMGATSLSVSSIEDLEKALAARADVKGPYVIVIDTDPYPSTPHGGSWWDVAVPQVSERNEITDKRAAYEAAVAQRQLR
ncbi:MAG: thiamine pyrophosphate-dependent enzyme, partial [Granulosicoccus sp.]